MPPMFLGPVQFSSVHKKNVKTERYQRIECCKSDLLVLHGKSLSNYLILVKKTVHQMTF